jgi:hypothetical protein
MAKTSILWFRRRSCFLLADVEDYRSGKIRSQIRTARLALKFIRVPYFGSRIGEMLQKNLEQFAIRPITMEIAINAIQQSEQCAIGERVRRGILGNSEFTESVFLNALAAGMVAGGRARYATKEGAIRTLAKYPENPLILSKVSGEYLEICCSTPGGCVYWTMRRKIG